MLQYWLFLYLIKQTVCKTSLTWYRTRYVFVSFKKYTRFKQ